MKRIMLLIYVVAFIAAIALPAAAMPLGVNAANRENRALASLPAFAEGGKLNLEFPKQFDSYMSDNFGFRQQYVTAWNALNYWLLGVSPDDSVIAGRDGWLFFGEEAHDYLGRGVLSESDISRITRTLRLQREYLESMGIRFVFTVAPNKSTIYGQYMPVRYLQRHADGNLDRLVAALQGSGVEYADLAAALDAEKGGAQLYHAKDSHWNNVGALAGYRSLMASIARVKDGFAWDDYADASYDFKRVWDADLETMLLPALGRKDMQAVFDIGQTFRYGKKPRSMEDMRIETEGRDGARLVMFRDSFANALIPFVSNAFSYACYLRGTPYDLTAAVKEQPDVVVEEIVERNIPNLLAEAPVMPAPPRDMGGLSVTAGGAAKVQAGETAGLLKLSGWVESEAPAGGAVFVELAGAAGSHAYEAFPIAPVEMPVGEPVRGFTLHIDRSALRAGEYAVNVLVQTAAGYQKTATALRIAVP